MSKFSKPLGSKTVSFHLFIYAIDLFMYLHTDTQIENKIIIIKYFNAFIPISIS